MKPLLCLLFNFCFIALTPLMSSSLSLAQSAQEHHAWQDAKNFKPFSRTAKSITGKISLSGNEEFAKQGSTMTMTFEEGQNVKLKSVGASWRTWSAVIEGKQTAEVFVLERNPGRLLNGNELCSEVKQKENVYVVFYEELVLEKILNLGMNVFKGTEPPFDINSEGLCATFSYALE